MAPRTQSGYARIAQAEEEEERPYYTDEDDDPFQDPVATMSTPDSRYAPIQPNKRDPMHMPLREREGGRPRRRRTNSGVDIKAINARLERWADEIKERLKLRRVKGKSAEEETLEIHHSVFDAPEGVRPVTKQMLEESYDDSSQRLSTPEFDEIVESVRTAIELGLHPKLISQGSSGSYFARNSGGKVVGVFKPKDEEPYASKNPKWTKWIHRNLFPFAFGRACLIPNLSYVSEAAAYVLDVQLRTNLTPYTDVVSLTSKSFYYDYWDRRAFHRHRKPLPDKQGSFQVFLKGYKGATEFFREHPWPEMSEADAPKPKKRRRGGASRPEGQESSEEEESAPERSPSATGFWTPELQQSFREELEKLVILDYVMRNTDRGTDNWMIRIDRDANSARIVRDPHDNGRGPATPPREAPRAPRIGAIDNSLSWPWKHPDAWRSYPFGWLFLPVSLIGQPFSPKTKSHFLPLLTSKHWWAATQTRLRRCFELDADFKLRMFARQVAVMKGQAWNVVETLKTPRHGPLELARRSRVCVYDDVVDVPVALPMARTPRAQPLDPAAPPDEAEMDISAMPHAPCTPPRASSDPFRASPSTNPFNHPRGPSKEAPAIASKEPIAPSSAPRPTAPRAHTHAAPARISPARRRFSLSLSRRPRAASDPDADAAADGDAGDLGYAAARTRERATRRVVVERIEVVKTRPPVFTWC